MIYSSQVNNVLIMVSLIFMVLNLNMTYNPQTITGFLPLYVLNLFSIYTILCCIVTILFCSLSE